MEVTSIDWPNGGMINKILVSEDQSVVKCVVLENIHTSPMDGFLLLPPPNPSGNSSLASFFP